MSEPRKLNTGDAQRTVYHAGDNASRSVRTPGSTSQEQYEEARRRAREAAAAGGRRTRQFSRVQPQDVAAYQARQAAGQSAPRQVNTAPRQVHTAARTVHTPTSAAQPAARPAGTAAQSAPRTVHRAVHTTPAAHTAPAAANPAADGDDPPLTMAQRQALALQRQAAVKQNAAASRARVQHLDLSKVQGEREAYDFDGDAFEEKQAPAAENAARAATGGSSARGGAGSTGGAARKAKGGAGSGGQPPKGPGKGKGGDGGGKKGGKGKKKRKAKWWQVLLATLLVLVVIFGATFALIMHAIRPEIGSATLSELINTPKEFAGKEFNVLVTGIDRSSEDGGSSDGVNDGMTDMILYVHFNNETGEVKMLQLPRNILVTDDASVSGNYQINAVAKTQGTNGNNNMNALATLINEQFGLPIDGYVSIRLEALVEMVDTFGGLQVYVPQTIDYRGVDGGGDSYLEQGWQTLDGAGAEFFLRARKTYGDSDITRLNTQRYFYAALFARLRSMTVWDIARMIPVFMNYMETDLKVSDIVSVAVSMLNVDSSKIMMAQVPVYMGQLYYNGNDIDVVDRQGTADLLNQYFRENLGPIDASELKVRDDLVDIGGRTPTPANVQFMGSINEEVVDAQQNDNLDGTTTTDVYQTPAPEPSPDPNAAAEDSGATSDDTADDAA